MSKVWLVKHPIAQYDQDVIKLAKENNLEIIDSKFANCVDPDMVVSGPELTIAGEVKVKKARKKRKTDITSAEPVDAEKQE